MWNSCANCSVNERLKNDLKAWVTLQKERRRHIETGGCVNQANYRILFLPAAKCHILGERRQYWNHLQKHLISFGQVLYFTEPQWSCAFSHVSLSDLFRSVLNMFEGVDAVQEVLTSHLRNLVTQMVSDLLYQGREIIEFRHACRPISSSCALL